MLLVLFVFVFVYS